MTSYIPLDGVWEFLDDQQKRFTGFPPNADDFNDTIILPGTTAQAMKGIPNEEREEDFLTEVYPYNGVAWFRKVVHIGKNKYYNKHSITLEMWRTRVSTVWVNGVRIGSQDSLCTPHRYELPEASYGAAEKLEIIIAVDNSCYPTKGGHMTSPDTQTNWNGILGHFRLVFHMREHIRHIKAIPDAQKREVRLVMRTQGAFEEVFVSFEWQDIDSTGSALGRMDTPENRFTLERHPDGTASVTIPLGKDAPLWDEYHPVVCHMRVRPAENQDVYDLHFGLTDFKADGHRFTNHGKPVFLRGKHDGMIFPLTGAAPETFDEWVKVFSIAKSYGINHYRFHTCCPPHSAFYAADKMGIFLEPEIPFWGSIHAPDDPDYNAQEQGYLIAEGRRILEEYGNHPSFAMFSLGNELWGSRERISEILRYYKQDEPRILFTQGCNNFQFSPAILPEDDFFVGVRLDRDRLIRGSYAMCDAPLGHVQTARPSAMHSYDALIRPENSASSDASGTAQEMEIQYGTGVKKVRMDQSDGFLVPDKPVVTHEIGQYCIYPDFREIEKYTGVLKARNFEIFRERLAEKGMLCMAEDFFRCSGQLAVQCYKEELEAAMRSEYLAGFQILDIQDFSGQGTALVGILDAFMDSKGLITPEKWRGFCSDSVILAQFPSYVLTSGEMFTAQISLRHHAPDSVHAPLTCRLTCGDVCLWETALPVDIDGQGLFALGSLTMQIPETDTARKLTLTLTLTHTENSYELWQFPLQPMPALTADGVCVARDWAQARNALDMGEKVLFLPDAVRECIEGFYCTDFWCYPMFRRISESMEKPVPVGTLGLCIRNEHPALAGFASEPWSTPQWYDIVTHANCAVLDDTEIVPIVQMIDNFERNHRLGILFECRVGNGSLLVCTARLSELTDRPEAAQFARGILAYAASADFAPEQSADMQLLEKIFG